MQIVKSKINAQENTNFRAKKKYRINVAAPEMFCTFAPTVPVLHTIRTAGGSFFLDTYGK
jgi:hypothetical protein